MLRIRSLRVSDFLSLKDFRWESIPDVALLYGDNNSGKTNVLVAVTVAGRVLHQALHGRIHESNEPDDPDRAPALGQRLPWPADCWAPFEDLPRHGRSAFTLEARFALAGDGRESNLDLAFRAEMAGGGTLVLERLELDGTELDGAGLDWARAASGGGLAFLADSRRWGEEILLDEKPGSWEPPSVDETGFGLKRRLLFARNHQRRDVRARVERDLKDILGGEPFHLGEPVPTLGANNLVDLYIGEHPVRSIGAAARQWCMMAAVATATDAAILVIDEPDMSFSWEKQEGIGRAMRRLQAVRNQQLILATHAPHLVWAADEERWWKVHLSADSGTALEAHESAEKLFAERNIQVLPNGPRPMVLLPGNLVRLPEDSVKHIEAQVGSHLVVQDEPDGVVRLETEAHFYREP